MCLCVFGDRVRKRERERERERVCVWWIVGNQNVNVTSILGFKESLGFEAVVLPPPPAVLEMANGPGVNVQGVGRKDHCELMEVL